MSIASANEKQAPKEIQVLDARKSQNLCMLSGKVCASKDISFGTAILLKTINLSPLDIKKAVMALDEYVLPRHVIDQLLKYVPTDEEIASIKEHENEFDKLGKPEKFYFEARFWSGEYFTKSFFCPQMSKIKRYGPRLECFFFKRVFDERVTDIEKVAVVFRTGLLSNELAYQGIQAISAATQDLFSSKRFKKLLEVILAVGNYLNSGFRGGAYGFKIDAILKVVRPVCVQKVKKKIFFCFCFCFCFCNR